MIKDLMERHIHHPKLKMPLLLSFLQMWRFFSHEFISQLWVKVFQVGVADLWSRTGRDSFGWDVNLNGSACVTVNLIGRKQNGVSRYASVFIGNRKDGMVILQVG